jgi:ribonuclease HI
MMMGAEHGYSPIEKHYLALIFAVKKLRHYILAHKVILISKVDPLKYLMTRPILTGRLAKWVIILTEFDITYMPQKTIKGQALADFLAAHPIQDNSPLKYDFPDEETLHVEEENPIWELYFDCASSIRPITGPGVSTVRAGAGLVFVTLEGGIIRHSLALTEPCTNNKAEYEALIAGLELSFELEIKTVSIFWDSQLIINQITGEYKVLKPELIQYHQKAMELMKKIPYVSIENVTRAINSEADALAKLAKELGEPTEPKICITVRNRRSLSLCQTIDDARNEDAEPRKVEQREAMITEEDGDWRQPFIEYFQHCTLPKDKRAADQLRKWVLRYAYVGNTLYRRSYNQLWQRCVSGPETEQVMKEIHSGLCRAHQSGPKMKLKIKRMRYYWPTMVADCEDHAKKWRMCQIHGPFIH